MNEIVWEDPPALTLTTKGRSAEFVAELKKHPGKWAIYPTVDGSHNRVNAALYLRRRYGVETINRNGVIYARWPEQ